MRILIDIQGLQNLSANRGIGRYVEALTRAIIEHRGAHEVFVVFNALFGDEERIRLLFGDLLPDHHVLAFYGLSSADPMAADGEVSKLVSEVLWEKLIFDIRPDFLLIGSLFDGFLDDSVTSIRRFLLDVPTAIILYDLIPFLWPERYLGFGPFADFYFRKLGYLKSADVLLSISDSARNEAMGCLDLSGDNIVNISSAVDSEVFCRSPLSSEALAGLGIVRPFLMHTSAFDERKNFEGLIAAFAKLEGRLRKNFQLVLVCKLSREQEGHLLKLGRNLGLHAGELVLTGFVSDSLLVGLYGSCFLFVFPSLHEGFGLPVLEAMSCGAPVIGSDCSSIPEVIGLEEALFDPEDVGSMADKITAVLTDEAFYSRLVDHSAGQVGRFSWAACAQSAISAFEQFGERKEVCVSAGSVRRSTVDLVGEILTLTDGVTLPDAFWVRVAECIDVNEREVLRLCSFSDFGRVFRARIEGPFDSSYSLALLNRETARALDALGHFVVLHSTEGPGDFEPNMDFLNANSDLKTMWLRGREVALESVDFVSRNLFPPRVADMQGRLNLLHHYAWEESGFPQDWVGDFNAHLSGVTCLSDHVRKVLVDNGVGVPLVTSGCGVDHWLRVVPDADFGLDVGAQTFRFLHVSSCFPRKGVEALLEAFGRAFCAGEDVVLVIKTFANPHNALESWLDSARGRFEHFPRVVVIVEDLSEARLRALYEQCDVLVAPSLAEGFGLPLAEAMLSGLPVITTNWGGQLDFCNVDNAWLVDFDFVRAESHFNLFNSVWACPKVGALQGALLAAFGLSKAALSEKAALGRSVLLRDFKWVDVASRLVHFVDDLDGAKDVALAGAKKLKLAWVSSWNTKCGIATYSDFLLRGLVGEFDELTILASMCDEVVCDAREENVLRCWGDRFDLKNVALNQALDDLDVDCVFFQFNFAFFDLFSLEKMILRLLDRDISVFITFHSVADVEVAGLEASLGWIRQSLRRVTNIFVHNVSDLNVLKGFGLVENVTLFPHGVLNRNLLVSGSDLKTRLGLVGKRVIASYGFMLPHKGILELIEAFALVGGRFDDVHLLLVNAVYPDPVSDRYLLACMEAIERLDLGGSVTLVSDFLSDEASFAYLDCADLLVMPYQDTQESASGAVRYAISTRKPVVCTPIGIFADVAEIVHFARDGSPAGLAEAVGALLSDDALLHSKDGIQDEWIEHHDWVGLSRRLLSIMRVRCSF